MRQSKYCSECGERIANAAKSRCLSCYLKNPVRDLRTNAPEDKRTRFMQQDLAFKRAMLAARKHPDPEWRISFSLGVDKTPCTSSPQRIDPEPQVRLGSSALFMVESAAGID